MGLSKTQSDHWADKDLHTIESYWSSPPATLRSKWFVDQLKKYQFNSVFEIGFFSGRNLRYISEAFPQANISGLDVNKRAVKFAQNKLPKADLFQMDLHDMDKIQKKYDVVFTSGVLIHVPPDDIFNVIQKCWGLTNQYIFHLEGLGKNEVVAGPKTLKPTYKVSDQLQWACNIVPFYRYIGFEVEVITLPDNCKTNGATELVIIDTKK